MRNSKRARNQKKRISRINRRFLRQRGSSDSNKPLHFSAFYNYVISNFENKYGNNGDLLTRQLNEYELNVCLFVMQEVLESIVNQEQEHPFSALKIVNVKQLEQPSNDKHFAIDFTVKNKSVEEATEIIRAYMEEVYAAGYTEFDQANYRVHQSNDPNRYYSSPGSEIDVVNI